MIDKDEKTENCNENLARVKLIADKKKQLEETSDQVQEEIKQCFARLVEILQTREKQLLRQVEAVHRQQLSLVQSNIELLPIVVNTNDEQQLKEQISRFGKIELSNKCIAVNDTEPYKVVEYQEADRDHVSFNKSLKHENLDCRNEIRIKAETSIGEASSNNALSESSESSSEVEDANPEGSDSTDDSSSDSDEPPSNCFPTSSEEPPVIFDNAECCSVVSAYVEVKTDDSGSPTDYTRVPVTKNPDANEHPLKQWLQQILAETETEPSIHEIGQFSEIPNTRLYSEFPVET